MYASVQPANKDEVDVEIKSDKDSEWFDAGEAVFGKIWTNSIALVAGWVHVLAG